MIGSTEIVREAHRLLYEAVPQSIPHIASQLSSIDLASKGRGEFIYLSVGLAALLHDIDENLAEDYFKTALAGKVHPAIKAGFSSIRRFTKDDYRRSSYAGVEIFEHKTLTTKTNRSPTDFVRSWLEFVPREDLLGISRIYLSENDDTAGYFGTYLPGLAVINILWHAEASKSRLRRFLHQRTLYHEIGHHAFRHKSGWQDPEQEDEAEEYAVQMMARAYPSLRRTANIIRWMRGRPFLDQ